MNLKTYQADSMPEALAKVRQELGPDAVIVKTKQTVRKHLGKSKPCYEVMAAYEQRAAAVANPTTAPMPSAAPRAAVPDSSPAGSAEAAPAGQYDWSGRLPRVSTQAPAAAPAEPPRAPMESLQGLRAEIEKVKEEAKMPTREMRMLREEIQSMLEAASAPTASGSALLAALDLPAPLAEELWRRAGAGSGPDARNPEVIRRALPGLMAEDLRYGGGVQLQAGRPARALFLGPAGAGKTSLIQKLAAQGRLRAGKRVGVLSADGRGFGAHSALALFAKTLGLPAACAYAAREMPAALHALRGCEIILIDSPALSAETENRRTLEALVRAAGPDEIHLVLDAGLRAREMRRMIEAAAALGPARLSFTRLDQGLGFGCLYAAARGFPGALGYFVSGPAATEHIEVASPEAMRRGVARQLVTETAAEPARV